MAYTSDLDMTALTHLICAVGRTLRRNLPMLHQKVANDRSIKNQSPSRHYGMPRASRPLEPVLWSHLRPLKQVIWRATLLQEWLIDLKQIRKRKLHTEKEISVAS